MEIYQDRNIFFLGCVGSNDQGHRIASEWPRYDRILSNRTCNCYIGFRFTGPEVQRLQLHETALNSILIKIHGIPPIHPLRVVEKSVIELDEG